MNESWTNVVLNLRYNILGSEEEKKKIITEWLNDIRSTGNVTTNFIVDKVFEKYP